MALIELKFRAVDDAHVADAHNLLTSARPPQHGEPRRFVGKAWDEAEERHVVAEDALIRCTPVELVQLRKHYAEACRDGHLVCVDEATAKAIGVPFTAAPAPVSRRVPLTPLAGA